MTGAALPPQPPPRPRPLTVAHVAQPGDGGVARAVVDLAREQLELGMRVVVVCPPGSALERGARAAGARVVWWPAARGVGPNLPWEAAVAGRAVRRAAADVVHLHSAKAGLAGRLAVRGRRATVFQPHAWSFEAVTGVGRRLAEAWERRAARWADRVVCVSERERAAGERVGIDARWAVIPNGVDLARFAPADGAARRRERAALGAAHGLPRRAPLVVCVGRLCRQKGQDVLVRAWPEVAARVPEARLVLVGDGPERQRLRAQVAGRRVPGVVFAGHAEEVWPWYAAADLVVLPSRWEGMALAPLEAMAVGRPVVVTDVGGGRESLPPGHAADCLVPPEDPGALARALAGLLGDASRRRVLARQAREHARSAHDVRRAAAECRGLYEEVLGRGAPAGSSPAVPGAGGRELARS